eukprot:TRINITY_DN30135_c0_g1_i2.p1 TRINITY_DN30135_c0_g1~~TRINITY_DN30135_c0_g1_i2.p1  ORF type:complete len:160 (-),score=47.01 TRINITY_DN30135_c0_g1_i2:81-506(-)
MAASSANELTAALNHFVSTLTDAHLGPRLQDLERHLQTVESGLQGLQEHIAAAEQRWQEKQRQVEGTAAAHQDRLQALEQAVKAKAGIDHAAQLQKSLESAHGELAEMERARAEQEKALAAQAEQMNEAILDLRSMVFTSC